MSPKPPGAKNIISTAAVEDINTTPITEKQQMLHDLFETWEGPLIESLASGKTPCKNGIPHRWSCKTGIQVPPYHVTYMYTNTLSSVGRNELYFVPKA